MGAHLETNRILVIDDNEENRLLARHALEDEGFQVTLASTGSEGLRAFEEAPADCVLLDVRMPGVDGFEVCERLRAIPSGRETPVIFLTALRDVETFDRAIRAGGDDFLTKPVRPTELVVRVESALKLRRTSSELREQVEIVRHQRDALLRLQLQKERLTSFVVHDLKNPVNSLDLRAQLLLRDEALPDRVREAAQGIRDDARTLLRLVLNLLDIAKSEEGRLEPKLVEVDLASLLGEVAADLETRARANEVTIARDVEPIRIRGDVDLLRRVFENLMDNALRYAPKRTTIRVAAVRTEQGAEVRVSDQGRGVPPELREKVFERFVQLDAGAVGERASRGLGLAFCKLAIEAHRGSIELSDACPGALFIVRLPA